MYKLFISSGLRWLWLAMIVLFIDLTSKRLVLKYLFLEDTLRVFPSLNFHYVRNYGAAFSFLCNESGWQYWVFLIVAVITCIKLLFLMCHIPATQKTINIACALIIGGTLGNQLDRLWHGFVIDMIDFYINDWHFAIFNFADIAIVVGVMLFLPGIFFR